MIEIPSHTIAQLLYLVHTDPEELREALGELRAPDVAEALRDLPPEAAAKVMAALPFYLAVQVFDEPELEYQRAEIVRHMDEQQAVPLIEAMSSDQQADLFRELPQADRPRFLKLLDEPTRKALELLLRYPPDTAGGIMTTEFVSMPVTWTVAQALAYVREVGRNKETVYAIYCLEPVVNTLAQVVSLRDLLLASDQQQLVGSIGSKRRPLTVGTHTDREDVARLISKYNLLAVPVVDE